MQKWGFVKFLFVVLVAAAVLSSCGGQQPPEASPSPEETSDALVLRVGMECAFAPHNWTQNIPSEYTVAMQDGTFVDGYDVQFAKIIAAELNMELKIIKVNWDNLTNSLVSGKIDLIIAGMTDTEKRRETIDFTDVYWTTDLVIVVKKDGPFADAESLADFSGARITAQVETTHYDLIDTIPGVIKQPAYPDFIELHSALVADEIDGYLAERPAAWSASLTDETVTFVAFGSEGGFGEEMPVSIGLRQGEDELRERINAILAEITEEQRAEFMQAAVSRQPTGFGG